MSPYLLQCSAQCSYAPQLANRVQTLHLLRLRNRSDDEALERDLADIPPAKGEQTKLMKHESVLYLTADGEYTPRTQTTCPCHPASAVPLRTTWLNGHTHDRQRGDRCSRCDVNDVKLSSELSSLRKPKQKDTEHMSDCNLRNHIHADRYLGKRSLMYVANLSHNKTTTHLCVSNLVS